MKTLSAPKDGKTHVANGRRFASEQDVKVYAYTQEMFVCHVSTHQGFTYYDLAAIPRQDQTEGLPS